MPMPASTETDIARYTDYLDRAVDEVFSTMMSVKCVPTAPLPVIERETISAVVGLAGTMSGSLVLYSGNRAAMCMTERLTGAAAHPGDPTIRDAMGEVCNMVAGAWKGFDEVLASGCLLSTPTVVAGTSYELFGQRAPVRIERIYRFEELAFTITIYCDPSQ
jgi:chemotaxis protein CheX